MPLAEKYVYAGSWLVATLVQLEAPAEDAWPLGQLAHELELVPPVLERYRPAVHAVQLVEVWELDAWKRPAGQDVQLLPDLY
jgi:hypothetical protein